MPKTRKPIKRDEDLGSHLDEEKLLDLYVEVQKGFENQRDRSDEILDNWDMYNCILSERQFYNGTSQIATPFVFDAVEARVTRFTNQVFPASGRFVEVISGEEDNPQATQSLIEGYVRKAKLRNEVVPALFRSGDTEGNWTVYVSWTERKRQVTSRSKRMPTTDGVPNEAAEPIDDVETTEVVDSHPDVEVLADPDVLILPATARSVDEALDVGGSVTVIRRWSKGKIKQLIEDGDIREEEGEALREAMNNQRMSKDVDVAKQQLDSAGIKERGKTALSYETWTKQKVEGERRLCRVYFGGEETVLGAKLNPFWNDRCPVISAPVKKQSGAAKGKAPTSYVSLFWIYANDTINVGVDTSFYSALPIVMTNPLTNPRTETMVVAPAAVWEVNPNDTSIVKFPELWSDALNRALAIKDQIFQTLGGNPSMIPQQTGRPGAKRNQAEMAIEQQVDILTTSDVVSNFEEGILTPLVQRFAEYDHQVRDEATTVKVFGEMGLRANMEVVEPIQVGERFEFRWLGVEAARNAAQMQQQTSVLNVFKQIPPNMYAEYDLNLAPAMAQMVENAWGPRIAPLIFKKKKLISTDPMTENELLIHGFDVQTAPMDDDLEHLKVHSMVLEAGADAQGKAQMHMMMHQQQMQAKMVAQMQQQQPGGGGGQGPKPGAQVAPPRQGKGPAGGIHPDQMPRAGVATMPRKT